MTLFNGKPYYWQALKPSVCGGGEGEGESEIPLGSKKYATKRQGANGII